MKDYNELSNEDLLDSYSKVLSELMDRDVKSSVIIELTRLFFEESRGSSIYMAKQKELFANAYNQWSEHDDIELKRLFHKGLTVKELSNHFERNTGGIRARLDKLQLR